MKLNATLEIYSPQKNLQGMTNNVGLTFSVGDTNPQSTIGIEQDNLVHLCNLCPECNSHIVTP